MTFSIFAIICVMNLSINPFCTMGILRTHPFDNKQSCDKEIKNLVAEINDDFIKRNIAILMVCKKNDKFST